LTLGSSSIDLQNEAGGWYCTNLNLGYPEVREVVNNRPDQDGIDDRTRYFGKRPVTADIVTYASSAGSIDDVADNFAPFMVPSARPVLHWILDRPGTPERTLVVRAAGYDWAVAGDQERDIHLAWVAADPIARATTTSSATAWAGSTAGVGRAYDLTFARSYPAGTSSSTVGMIRVTGDVPVYPLYRIYGPITRPIVSVGVFPANRTIMITFLSSFTIGSGQWVDVDSARKTAVLNSDPAQSVLSSIDWLNTKWGAIDPPNWGQLTINGSSTSPVTQVQAIWTEGFLS
jgi:hypothetical protein